MPWMSEVRLRVGLYKQFVNMLIYWLYATYNF